MHKGLKAAASLAAVLLSSAAALAQGAPNPPGNLEKLSNFQGTGASMDIPTIAQGGRKADAIALSASARQRLRRAISAARLARIPSSS